MPLADIGNIVEFVASIVLVASLIYFAIQIRQNSRLLRASAIQSATSNTANGFVSTRDPMAEQSLNPAILSPDARRGKYGTVSWIEALSTTLTRNSLPNVQRAKSCCSCQAQNVKHPIGFRLQPNLQRGKG